jgi:UDP-N-acetyl-D-galactosamine dehydrogenase
MQPKDGKVLIMGLTFKEDCPDVRNTRVVDIVAELESYGLHVDVHDPWVDPAEARHEYGIDLVENPKKGDYDGIIVAVGHRQFRQMGAEGIRAFGKQQSVLYDIKYVLPADAVDDRL